MAPREFTVGYDDFSGGYFVGPVSTKQPKNTWVGDDIMAVESDGTLMPSAPATARSGYAPAAIPSNVGVTRDGAYWGFVSGTTFSYSPVATLTGNPSTLGFSGLTGYGRCVPWSSQALMFPTTTTSMALFTYPSTIATYTTPVRLSGLVQFGPFAVGAQFNSSRIYYSQPGDLTNWPSTNFYDIGAPLPAITALLVVNNTLYVGKADSWYTVTGVLGATAIVQPVTAEGPSGASDVLSGGVVTADGILLQPGRRVDGTIALALRGSTMEPVAYSTPTGTPVAFGQIGMHAVLAGPATDAAFWLRSPTGKWRRYSMLAAGETTIGSLCDGPAFRSTAYMHGSTGALYHLPVSPTDPPLNAAGTAYASASAVLPEYHRDDRFHVREVVVELDLGITASNLQRSVQVGIRQSGVPVDGAIPTNSYVNGGAAMQTFVLSAMNSTNEETVTLRFKSTDGPDSFTARPLVTLEGVKLRRLTMHCVESKVGG